MIRIRAERHFFTRLHIEANPKFNPDGPAMIETKGLQSTINTLLIDNDPGAFVCTQSVFLETDGDSHLPYKLDVECVGFFRAENPEELQAQKDLGTTIAHQVLYAAVREMVLTVAARMAWGPFSIGLATLNAAEKKEEATEPTPKAAKRSSRKSNKTA